MVVTFPSSLNAYLSLNTSGVLLYGNCLLHIPQVIPKIPRWCLVFWGDFFFVFSFPLLLFKLLTFACEIEISLCSLPKLKLVTEVGVCCTVQCCRHGWNAAGSQLGQSCGDRNRAALWLKVIPHCSLIKPLFMCCLHSNFGPEPKYIE